MEHLLCIFYLRLCTSMLLLDLPLASSWHSLRYFHFATLDTGQDLPSFTAMGYLDDQLFATYSSKTKEYKPCLPWAEKNLSVEYWEGQSGIGRGNEKLYRVDLVILRNRYNQTGGFHTLQYMGGCEVGSDGQKSGYSQFAYDGRDFISFDAETLTWVAASAEAQVTKQKLSADETLTQSRRYYLEEVCVGWLRKFLACAGEKSLRREVPVVTLTRKAWRSSLSEDLETLICRVDGFYPKDIEVVWTRDGEVWEEETLHGLVAPNSDGTYHTWISITVSSKERNRFRCRVDHASLAKPIVSAMDEPEKSRIVEWAIAGVIFAALLIAGGTAFCVYTGNRHEQLTYEATSSA